MNKLLVWGIGKRADDYMKGGYLKGNCIEGFVDSSCKKEQFYGYPVFKPVEAYELSKSVDYIIISTK